MAERGWWGGLLDETAKLPQGIRQLVVDAVTRQPRTDPTQPVVTPGPGGLLDLTPVPALTEAYKATDDVGKGGYEGGQAVGKYLSGLLGIIPAVGAVRKAGPIRAYHGSPHNFDKFDISKIGTGEGAQAYGHGLYFAGNEDVAKSYKKAGDYATREVDVINGQLSRIARELDQYHGGEYGKYTSPKGYELKAQYDALMAKRSDLGHMYEVGIHADPAKMIDWDKPLSQQSEAVKSLDDLYWQQHAKRQPDITTFLKSEEAAKAAQERGIPGIKYLDQGSRPHLEAYQAELKKYENLVEESRRKVGSDLNNQALREELIKNRNDLNRIKAVGPGTSNYVVFDPAIIEILRKYGLLPAAAGAAATTVPGLLNEEKQY